MLRAFIPLFFLAGCQLIGPDDFGIPEERTFPESQDLSLVDLEQVLNEEVSPGEYNVKAFVVGMNECPGDACQIPDGITLAAKVRIDYEQDFHIHIPVQKPKQFQRLREYLFSIRIIEEGPPNSRQLRRVRIIGYD